MNLNSLVFFLFVVVVVVVCIFECDVLAACRFQPMNRTVSIIFLAFDGHTAYTRICCSLSSARTMYSALNSKPYFVGGPRAHVHPMDLRAEYRV